VAPCGESVAVHGHSHLFLDVRERNHAVLPGKLGLDNFKTIQSHSKPVNIRVSPANVALGVFFPPKASIEV